MANWNHLPRPAVFLYSFVYEGQNIFRVNHPFDVFKSTQENDYLMLLLCYKLGSHRSIFRLF